MITAEEMEALVRAYVEYARTDETSQRKDELFWAFKTVSRLSEQEPEQCFDFIVAVLRYDQGDRVMELVAAGPMEDLLVHHGPDVIDRLEATAKLNPAFRDMLGGVWRNEITESVWNRVMAARGPTW